MAFPVLGQPFPQFVDQNGNPYSSGTLEIRNPADNANKSTYPTAADADAATNANSADLTLNQSGRPSVGIWGVNGQEYKVTLKDSAGATIWTATHIAWDISDSMISNVITQATIGSKLYPRTAAETAASVTPTYYYYEPGDVRRYGAVGDGSTDDYAAFAAAILQNEQSGGAPIHSHSKTYYIGTGLEWGVNTAILDKIWFADRTLLTTSADINLLTIGRSTAGQLSQRLTIAGFLSLTHSVGIASSTKSGLLMKHAYRCVINVEVFGFYYGIHLQPPDYGCNYNTFYLGQVKNCYDGIKIDNGTAAGNANENTFYGGSFQTVSINAGHYINIVWNSGTSDRPNNNLFFRPAFDGSGGTIDAGYYDQGFANTLFQPRLEMGQTINTGGAQVVYAEDSTRCMFIGGIYSRVADTTSANQTIIDNGTDNTIFASDGLRINGAGQGRADSVLRVHRDRPNNDSIPAVVVRDIYDDSNNSMAIYTGLARSTVDGYHLLSQDMGEIVWVETANGEIRCFECILAHTSATANDKPGSGTNWKTYWANLNSETATETAGKEWADATSYTARTTAFSVRGNGALWTNQVVADASAPPANVTGKIEIFDQTGVSKGFIPVYASI